MPARSLQRILLAFLSLALTQAVLSAQDEKKLESYGLALKATLGDNRLVSGRVEFKAPARMMIAHTRDEVQYEKSLSVPDISFIEILEWKGRKVKEAKHGNVFEFRPARIMIHLKSGLELERRGDLPFLQEFQLTNQNGQVKLFTYWMDLQKPDGTWYTEIQGPELTRRICHKDIVKRIDFSGNNPEAGDSGKQEK